MTLPAREMHLHIVRLTVDGAEGTVKALPQKE